MAMSKKNYVATAALINETLWEPDTDPATIVRITVKLCKMFSADNERFDTHRFVEACLSNPNDTAKDDAFAAYRAERERLGI